MVPGIPSLPFVEVRERVRGYYGEVLQLQPPWLMLPPSNLWTSWYLLVYAQGIVYNLNKAACNDPVVEMFHHAHSARLAHLFTQ